MANNIEILNDFVTELKNSKIFNKIKIYTRISNNNIMNFIVIQLEDINDDIEKSIILITARINYLHQDTKNYISNMILNYDDNFEIPKEYHLIN